MVLVATLNPVTMDVLQLFRGDTIIVWYAIKCTYPQANLIIVAVVKNGATLFLFARVRMT